MLARVSNIESYRRWKNWQPWGEDDVEPTVEEFVSSITTDEPNERMQAGTAFHAALEAAQDGAHETFEALGYTFLLPDAEIAIPLIREQRVFKEYGGLTVTGKVDCIEGRVVTDHKSTARVDVESYLEGLQWRFYLDVFEADTFVWNLFPVKEVEPRVYRVSEPQTLRAYRYPELHQDCVRHAADYLAFARLMNLPDARID